jgi:ABC-2 type transport system permease protein
MFAILKREFKTYFLTPTGYIYMSLFLLVSGIFFSYGNLLNKSAYFSYFLSNIVFIFLLVVPVLTMRLFTDEKRLRTEQLLLTSPVRISDIVLGKYLAAVGIFLFTVLITVIYAVIISFHGELDTWESVGAYIGFILIGMSFIAVGIFVSSTTENQVVAAIVTFCALLVMWIIDLIQQGMPSDAIAGAVFAGLVLAGILFWLFLSIRHLIITVAIGIAGVAAIVLLYIFQTYIFYGLIGKVLEWFSLIKRYENFSMGVVKLSDIIYYLSFSSFFLFLTVRLIDKKRWS